MSEYHEKFLEAEKQASNLVKQLEDLKKETGSYKDASGQLDLIGEKIGELINDFSLLVNEEKNLINTLKEIGTEKIFEEIELNRTIFNEKMDVQNNLFSKLFIFIYLIIGINVLIGILLIIFK